MKLRAGWGTGQIFPLPSVIYDRGGGREGEGNGSLGSWKKGGLKRLIQSLF